MCLLALRTIRLTMIRRGMKHSQCLLKQHWKWRGFFPWKKKNNFSATALSGTVFGEHFGSVCHSSSGKVWGMNLWCTLETAQTACICQICVFKTQALTWAICPSKYSTQHVHLVHFEVLLYSTGPFFCCWCFNSSSASFNLDLPPPTGF